MSAAAGGAGATPLICVPEDAEAATPLSLCVPKEESTTGKSRFEELTETVAEIQQRLVALEKTAPSYTEFQQASPYLGDPERYWNDRNQRYTIKLLELRLEKETALRALDEERVMYRIAELESTIAALTRVSDTLPCTTGDS
jgi:hypothetical protein